MERDMMMKPFALRSSNFLRESDTKYTRPAAIPATNRDTIKGWDQHRAHLLFST
jgi:hypothetical protein